MPALWGRMLDVDLTRGRVGEYRIPEDWTRLHLGGRGIAARILLGEVKGRPDPFGPENVLAFMTGPMTGMALAGSGRHGVYARSPLTGFFGEAYGGGFFGTELARTGWDGVILRGASAEPRYLHVTNETAELHPADALWGRTVSDTTRALLERHVGHRVACIGAAGENLVRFAAVMNDWNRAAGRTGMGAVMGSKRLKAIVVKGSTARKPVDPERYREAMKRYTATLTTPGMKEFGKYGTAGGVTPLSELGILPTRYWRAGSHPKAEDLDGVKLHDEFLAKRDNCTACPVHCKRVVETRADGQDVEALHGGPEYETIAAFGCLQEVADLRWVSLANKLCNEHGLDTISTGSVIAWAMEATERGLLSGAAGIAFGDARRASALIHAIARREGIGDTLAEGVRRASEHLGGSEFAVHVKGCEVPMHEPRGKKALGLSYAVTPRGANHMEGLHDTMLERDNAAPELGLLKGMSRFAVEGKAHADRVLEDVRSFTNSLVVCAFDVVDAGRGYNVHLLRECVAAATGLSIDKDEMLRIGERNYQLGRLFAVRMGLTRADDDLPKRFKDEALPFGKRREAVTDGELDRMLAEYYAERGWGDDGAPTRERLQALGLAAATA